MNKEISNSPKISFHFLHFLIVLLAKSFIGMFTIDLLISKLKEKRYVRSPFPKLLFIAINIIMAYN